MVDRSHIIAEFNAKVKPFFKALTFHADSHSYYVGGKKTPKSVSSIVHKFVKETDFAAIAQAIDRRDRLKPGTTAAAWKAKTEKACADGSEVHDFAENVMKAEQANNNKKKAVMKFWSELNREFPGRYIIIAKEVGMYHKTLLFPGTSDVTVYDTWTDTIIIADYKTNEDLFKNHQGQMMLSPFGHLLDCPYNHYQVQLSLYQILLNQANFRPVSERWLIYLTEKENEITKLKEPEYKLFKLHDYSATLQDWLQANKNKIAA